MTPPKPRPGMAALLAAQRAEAATTPQAEAPATPRRPDRPDSPASTATPKTADASTATPKTADASTATPGSRSETAKTRSPSSPASPASSGTLRSWYMSANTARTLSDALDEMHHSLPNHPPKHVILAEIIRLGLGERDTLRANLREWRP
jgi:hypothetical protein